MTKTSPPPCPACKGSRRVVILAEDFDDLEPAEKLRHGVGFYHAHCLVCFTAGTLHPDTPGDYPPCPPDYEPEAP